MTSLQMKFGQKLRTVRLAKDISQEDLAHLADLDRTYVSTIERGLKNVSLSTIGKLAKALKVKMAELMPD